MHTRLWAQLAPSRPERRQIAMRGHHSRLVAGCHLPVAALAAVGVAMWLGVAAARVGGTSPGPNGGGWWGGGWAVVLASTVLAVAAGSAVVVRRQVVAPLRRLEQLAVRALDGQDYPSDIAPAGSRVGPLAAAVSALASEVGRSRRSVSPAAMIEASPDLTVVVGADGLISTASAAATRMLGRPSGWLPGTSLAGLVHAEDRTRLEDLQRRPAAPGGRSYEELRLSHLHGYWVFTEVSVVDMTGDPAVQGLVLNIRDVSDRKAREDDLMRRALHDPLTGLVNRRLFREHVEHALARLRRTPARPHAVLFVDLDDFKTVNDSLGHAAGDEVLVEVGKRLRRWMRPGDTAARLGGDEFAVLVENTSQNDTDVLAQRILQVLQAPLVLHGKEVVLTGSIGIALSKPGQEADELLRNADVAMYTAKGSGKGQYRVFEPEMHQAALQRLDLEADLRHAISRDELFLEYQPIVDLTGGGMCGVEVLVRWRHPERGLIQPLDFITVAEDSGLIRPMGRFILEQACRQVKQWQDRFPSRTPLRLCVNASVRQIEHSQFYDEVAVALERSGLDGHSLTLEITESLFMNDFPATVEKLCRLKELGLKLAVDDFGTGYSSLSYLRELPIDILKIDKSFVVGVTQGPEQSAVARAVVKLARTFNLQTVAEGIERPDQAAELLAIGAQMGQGYWYSRPLGVEAMEAFMAEDVAATRFGQQAKASAGDGAGTSLAPAPAPLVQAHDSADAPA